MAAFVYGFLVTVGAVSVLARGYWTVQLARLLKEHEPENYEALSRPPADLWAASRPGADWSGIEAYVWGQGFQSADCAQIRSVGRRARLARKISVICLALLVGLVVLSLVVVLTF